MNSLYKTVFFIAVAIGLCVSCTPEEYELGSIDVTAQDLAEGIAYTITHDASNPNIVHLESKMQGYTPLWSHPQGRSQEPTVTLQIAFPGTYDVVFGVMTPGGIVYGETAHFVIDEMYAGFISDPMWTLLSGGIGGEKTWYLDLDANAVSRGGAGPLYFYGTDDSWETVTEGKTVDGDSWNWCPDYPGNTWLFAAADFGTMTFDMKDGANVKVEHLTIPSRGTESGTFLIDVDAHTLKMVDAAPLHDATRDGIVTAWGDIKIMSLTADYMQLGVLRDNDPSEGPCLLVYNYISKDYLDNWTPGETAEPEPVLPDGWQDAISQTVSTSVKWILSPETPFNWANLDGSLMNADWVSPDTYADWTGFNASVSSSYASFSLLIDSESGAVTYTSPSGVATSGTYSLSSNGTYTFTGISPSFHICGDISLATSSDNTWRITRIERNMSGKVTGMWVGVRDAVKPEYMVYHLIPQAAGAAEEDPLKV
ncbi:MAG: hypothetical protein LBQ78_02765 [Tannerellaceae bacterium]|jgi:hypothetical protein|nr:hypothetical protein [Tannerellaceae bacterium]